MKTSTTLTSEQKLLNWKENLGREMLRFLERIITFDIPKEGKKELKEFLLFLEQIYKSNLNFFIRKIGIMFVPVHKRLEQRDNSVWLDPKYIEHLEKYMHKNINIGELISNEQDNINLTDEEENIFWRHLNIIVKMYLNINKLDPSFQVFELGDTIPLEYYKHN